MRAGRLDRLITIYSRVQALNSFKESVDSYVSAGEVWAEYLPANAAERWVNPSFVAETECVFKIYWRADIGPLNQIEFEGRRYDVLGTMEIGRREGLAISARARAE